ncbi:hypothetical protein [Natronolimnobius baerhuensis]|uniref:DUF7975 domain-containing protein n=1 Tax=Natronolimnobius baerhuensis TaxID=253108 RepID=A0A202E7V3_9EURY|nr:hypothetical protein [Natronolimnobius baerhuensis]OVE84341.1 hypothetical protein B2G88_07965 [Natronolimnobius baerhuensis]
MTRFDATEPADRQQLYADAITAHRERGSGYLTLEVDTELLKTGETDADGSESDGDDSSTHTFDPELGVPWVQFGDGTINLDCTADELEELKTVLEEFAAFTIDDIVRPNDIDGINVRISANADQNRIAQFIEAVFRQVYGLPENGRVWVTEI